MESHSEHYVDEQERTKTLFYYQTTMAKVKYLAQILINRIPQPMANEGYRVFRTHTSRCSYLATFRALNLIEEFSLATMPSIGLPRSGMKTTLYYPSDIVFVTSIDNKPLFDFLTTTKPITVDQNQQILNTLKEFEKQLYTPIGVRHMYNNSFKIINHPMLSILPKGDLALNRASKLLDLLEVDAEQDRKLFDIYDVIATTPRPKDRHTAKWGNEVEQFIFSKVEKLFRGEPYSDLPVYQQPTEQPTLITIDDESAPEVVLIDHQQPDAQQYVEPSFDGNDDMVMTVDQQQLYAEIDDCIRRFDE